MFVEVILPLAVPNTYTYDVPPELADSVRRGVRVEVQFGRNRLYAALVLRAHHDTPLYRTKPILSVLDAEPIITDTQLDFWAWLAAYYCCFLGEVMNAALPSGLRLGSETRILLKANYLPQTDNAGNLTADDLPPLNDSEYLVVEALLVQPELSIAEVQAILDKQQVHGLIKSMLERQIIVVKEELQHKYKPKEQAFVQLTDTYSQDIARIKTAIDALPKNAERQVEVLLAMVQLTRNNQEVPQKLLCETANCTPATLQSLAAKGILLLYKKQVSRTAGYDDETLLLTTPLSAAQAAAVAQITAAFETKNTTLLYGATGSGKTRIYTELIQKTLAEGRQVLYLLPEIALTAQITHRLQKVFGSDIAVYHSKLNNNERVDLWKEVLQGKKIILGARSSLFLPFRNLGLIVIDEEHDPSYKQHEPNPRYNARDAAIYLAHRYGAKVLLGTATPSIETYYNAQHDKYGLVLLNDRFGGVQMPETKLIDLKNAQKRKQLNGNFSEDLLAEIKETLARKEQVILFQNRRGYAPAMQCTTCGWTAECVQCDVSLTYHLQQNSLRCHYCGYTTKPPQVCTACGATTLQTKGFGTEKIEEELQILLPEARIARMDLDTVRGKAALSQLIQRFEEHELDILVGTQMVTKGLDFEKVRLVGILSADQLLHFPDFRASERAFQLITQVSGRAGRSQQRGLVLIQSLDTSHPVIDEVLQSNGLPDRSAAHYLRELQERHKFSYPPFFRLIGIELRHKDRESAAAAAHWFANALRPTLGAALLGPTEPGIGRVRNYYLQEILLKIDRNATHLTSTKAAIMHYAAQLQQQKGFTTTQIIINVDPY